MNTSILLFILLGLALVFNFLNGFHDSANVVATIISSRAMSPRGALTMAAIAEFAGPFIFGVAVATTIGTEIVLAESITIQVLFAALFVASLWNIITWAFGLPSSSSHALIGGLVGAVSIGFGLGAIHLAGIIKIVAALFLSPIVGFIIGVIIMNLLIWLTREATPAANIIFKLGQVPTALALALSHGANDAQKAMGIITMGLVILKFQPNFSVPWWVVLINASSISLGTAVGGWRIIRTLGAKFYRVRPIHSFASQFSSAVVILTSSLLGGPVSTTQVVSSAILGVGAAQRKSQVRWGILSEMLLAWFLTIPVTAGLGAIFFIVIKFLLP